MRLLRPACWLLALAIFLIAGCAHPTRATGQTDSRNAFWSGRLALTVQSEQPQSFAAGFELKGHAGAGELALFTPLGSTLAVLAWTPDSATLQANGETRGFDSLDALASHVTGTAIPVAALFDWLAGTPSTVLGWQADLSQLGSGRLVARRSDPPPAAELRLAFER